MLRWRNRRLRRFLLVFGNSIADTVTFVSTGNVDVGIIALSLNDETKFTFSLINSDMHEPLRQTIAVLKSSKQQKMARDYISLLLSVEGQTIMQKYGFTLPNK